MSTPTTSPTGSSATDNRSWRWPLLLSVYLIVIGAVALCLANYTWPHSKSLKEHVRNENKPKLWVAITADSLRKLYTAQDGVSRWQILGPAQITEKDKAAIQAGLQLASQLETHPKPAPLPIADTGTNSISKTELVTNYFNLANNTTSTQMLSTVRLKQVAVTITTTATPVTTNAAPVTNTARQPFILPVAGDLRLVSARTLANAMEILTQAITNLQSRAAFMETDSAFQPPTPLQRITNTHKPIVLPTNVPGLTAIEKADLKTRLDELVASENESRLSTPEFDLLMLTLLFGAFGGAVKCLASLAQHLAEQKFDPCWKTYYFVYPFIGGALGVAFFLVIRGGIVKDMGVGDGNLVGICALAMIVGMFSDEAMKKLAKVAMAIFTDNTVPAPGDTQIPAILSSKGGDSSILELGHITRPESFAEKLKDAMARPDAMPTIGEINDIKTLTLYLAKNLKWAKLVLEDYKGVTNQVLQQAMIEDLNHIIADNPLYLAPYFIKSATSPDVFKRLLKIHELAKSNLPPASELDAQQRLLNRLLLTSAYPDEMVTWVVILVGKNFQKDSTVLLDGAALNTGDTSNYINANLLELKLKLANHEPGNVTVVISNPPPNSGQSSPATISLA
jgi:hypothetical protein